MVRGMLRDFASEPRIQLTPGASLYPPTTPGAFRRLLGAIHSAPIDRLKSDCFIYYLVRDRDAKEGGMDVDGSGEGESDNSNAAKFARRRCLPRTWKVYMDGYWALDHGDYKAAVDHLSGPSISEIDFLPQVVEALTTEVSPPSEALALVHELVNPDRPLSTAGEAAAALLATASVAGMSAAFARIRALPDAEERGKAREAVWCWSLGVPRSPAGRGEHKAQPRALRELLNLALSDEESDHLVHFLAHCPRNISTGARSLLHDLVTLRLVHAGKYEESLALDKELAATDAASASDRQRRREMVREFIDILPEAQRRILLGADYARSANSSNVNGVPNGEAEDVDMSSSWVHVAETPAQPPASNGGVIAPTPIRPPVIRSLAQGGTPARSQSPFGGPPRFSSPRAAAQSSRNVSPVRSEAPSTATPLPPQLRQSPPPSVASPFNPPTASSSRATPRKPKKIIVDDSPPLRRSTRRRSSPPSEDGSPERTRTTLRAPSEPPIPEDAPAPTPKTARRARRTTAVAEKAEPKATPKRRSTRASTVESTAEDDDHAVPGAYATPRVTRSASRAHLGPLDDEQPVKKTRKTPTAAKRTTRAASEVTEDRRITRAMSEVSEVESVTPRRRRASPTPSATSQSSPARRRTTRVTRSNK